jgi:hypothetical protein
MRVEEIASKPKQHKKKHVFSSKDVSCLLLHYIKRFNIMKEKDWLSIRHENLATYEVFPKFQAQLERLQQLEQNLGITDVCSPSLFLFVVISFLHSLTFHSFLSHFQPKDWFSMTLEDLAINAGIHFKSKAELGKLLEHLYPHIDWSTIYLYHGRLAQQRHLERVVRSLFQVL